MNNYTVKQRKLETFINEAWDRNIGKNNRVPSNHGKPIAKVVMTDAEIDLCIKLGKQRYADSRKQGLSHGQSAVTSADTWAIRDIVSAVSEGAACKLQGLPVAVQINTFHNTLDAGAFDVRAGMRRGLSLMFRPKDGEYLNRKVMLICPDVDEEIRTEYELKQAKTWLYYGYLIPDEVIWNHPDWVFNPGWERDPQRYKPAIFVPHSALITHDYKDYIKLG